MRTSQTVIRCMSAIRRMVAEYPGSQTDASNPRRGRFTLPRRPLIASGFHDQPSTMQMRMANGRKGCGRIVALSRLQLATRLFVHLSSLALRLTQHRLPKYIHLYSIHQQSPKCPADLCFRAGAAARYDQGSPYGIASLRTICCKGTVLWLSNSASFPGRG
jgi:hypothetical protein